MKKLIHKVSITISALFVFFALFIDFNPRILMGGMGKILLYGIPMLLLFCNMLYQIKKTKEEKQKEKIKKQMLWGIFSIYLIALFSLLFLGSSYRQNSIWIYQNKLPIFSKENIEETVNLIPFKTIIMYIQRFMEHSINIKIVFTNIVGNIIAFAPFGFFLPILANKKISNGKRLAIIMLILVMLVELIQFLTRVGQADIDDVILNVAGALITYSIFKVKGVKEFMQKIVS